MSRKPLLIVESDEEIKDIKESLDNGYKMFEEAQEFMKRQQEESWEKLVGSHWTKIESVLLERKILPTDFSKEKYSLGFRDGVLYLTDKTKDQDDIGKSFFDMLFKGK